MTDSIFITMAPLGSPDGVVSCRAALLWRENNKVTILPWRMWFGQASNINSALVSGPLKPALRLDKNKGAFLTGRVLERANNADEPVHSDRQQSLVALRREGRC
ncbi:MAG: hypothetical protein VYB26_06685 [Pseudomonadota bacterium]|nr:hypothetical protein [Pseudomonadota bacterium]